MPTHGAPPAVPQDRPHGEGFWTFWTALTRARAKQPHGGGFSSLPPGTTERGGEPPLSLPRFRNRRTSPGGEPLQPSAGRTAGELPPASVRFRTSQTRTPGARSPPRSGEDRAGGHRPGRRAHLQAKGNEERLRRTTFRRPLPGVGTDRLPSAAPDGQTLRSGYAARPSGRQPPDGPRPRLPSAGGG